MDAQALAAEVKVLSANYSIDTVVNFHPRRGLGTPGIATTIEIGNGNGNGTVPELSPSVLAFLAARHEDVVTLVNKPVVRAPLVPDDLPLKRYFISSSHNTYLLAWQLLGRSSAAAYTHVLLASTPARCIEIDVWWDGRPGRGIPVVTHGWTLSKSVSFVDVCVAIREAVKSIGDGRDWPVLINLECHVPLAYQDGLVRVMVECWGEMLVQGKMEGLCGETVTPRQLRGRIVLMVEYYPGEAIGGLDQDVVSETECKELDGEPWVILENEGDRDPCSTDVNAALVYPKIADSLANLGFYARSMKPPKVWWRQVFPSPPHPLNVALNIDERHLPHLSNMPALQQHATRYLRRVYPHGLRVTSSNLDPCVQWRSGTQMACLNWQRRDEAMWLNEAMFGGTGGWVVKPDPELVRGLEGGDRGWRRRFTGRVVGLSALPQPEGDERLLVGYCQAELFHRDGKRVWQSNPTRVESDAAPVAGADHVGVVHLTWDQTFEWTFNTDVLAFLQLKVVRRHVVKRDEVVAVFCARLDQLTLGWCLVRLLDMRGKYIGATLLCEFALADVEAGTY